MSGKGGVGKLIVIVLFVNKLNKMGYKVGILDLDIIGLSIFRFMGVKNVKVYFDGFYIYFVENLNNIKVMFINFMIDDENEFVVWRGFLFGGVVK